MKVLIFGATGMVGQGVLRACLDDPEVALVRTVGRTAPELREPRLEALVQGDLLDLAPLEDRLSGFDACFYCLGASAAGRSEAEDARLNHDLPLAAARTLARLTPGLAFAYVSGAGTDPTERGRSMWARVKGRTENDLLRLPLRVTLFRPGLIQATHGEVSRTPAYRWIYLLARPLFPLLHALLPNAVTTTDRIGRAMLQAARHPPANPVLESRDINRLAAEAPPACAGEKKT
jgi:uncharacterized protein YbjT (DUF2867 family)